MTLYIMHYVPILTQKTDVTSMQYRDHAIGHTTLGIKKKW